MVALKGERGKWLLGGKENVEIYKDSQEMTTPAPKASIFVYYILNKLII